MAVGEGQGISAELTRLAELHARGQLTDDEFAAAKARLLGGQGQGPQGAPGQPVGFAPPPPAYAQPPFGPVPQGQMVPPPGYGAAGAPPSAPTRSGVGLVLVILGVVVGALFLIGLLAIVAITLLGSEAQVKFSSVGSAISAISVLG
ncbi:MAG: SHOCT domain-containing protein [Acidimicrobiales bacterium]|jgi:hypothetical protein|nr:SHOCT domain-containing protein [Acidimicrobiales bacterium]